MRNLVFFADGTWNDTDDPQNLTNVFLLSEMSQSSDAQDAPQLTRYQPGVGTSGSLWDRLSGGGLGKGLDDKIIEAYLWLAEQYRPTDYIFLFGFSRGAYTVRSLVGMINTAQLLDLSAQNLTKDDRRTLAEAAFSTYRERGVDQAVLSDAPMHPLPDIRFLGCWDTVGSLGIPDDLSILKSRSRSEKYDFNDTRLSMNVATARHAVSIDERRRAYAPTIWDETSTPRHPDMRQKWFSGVHSNVGGGYANRGLSDVALKWMMEEAVAAGLLLKPDAAGTLSPQPLAEMENSHSGVFRKMKSRPRSVPSMLAENAGDIFSPAVCARHAADGGYWPTKQLDQEESVTVAISSEHQWVRTNLFLETGATYAFVAEGRWQDAGVAHGPGGATDQTRQWGHRFGDAYRWLESRITGGGNVPSTASLARRFDGAPWFALIGVIANGSGVDQITKDIVEHETFLIGARKDKPVEKGGYLYCYANDAWNFYGNNEGSISLTVTRIG